MFRNDICPLARNENVSPRNPCWWGRLSTDDLIVLTSLDKLLWYWKHYLLFYSTSYLNEEVVHRNQRQILLCKILLFLNLVKYSSKKPTLVKHLSGAPLLGRLLALPTNTRRGWLGLPETNTLAYYRNS